MKRLMTLLVVIFCLTASLAVQAEPEYVIKLSFGNSATPGAVWYQHFVVFKEELERLSEGRMTVKIYPNSQLGTFSSTQSQVQAGIIEAAVGITGAFSEIYPEIQVVNIPYLFPNKEVAWAVLDGPFGQALREDIREKTGLRVFGFLDNGFRHTSNSVREIRRPEDLEGLKIRTMPSPLHMQVMKSLGAEPVPIPLPELYTALQTGVVDGQENSWHIYPMRKLGEVQDFLTDDGHVYDPFFVILNDDFYQGLPDDLQEAVRQAAETEVAFQRQHKAETDEEGKRYLEESGVQITYLTPEERAAFREAAQGPGIQYIRDKIGDEWVDRILAAVEEAEETLGD